MLILIGLVILYIRFWLYPYADMPDILDTIPSYLPSALHHEIYYLWHNLPVHTTTNVIVRFITGGDYASAFSRPDLSLYLWAITPYIFLVILFQVLANFFPVKSSLHSLFHVNATNLLLLPSTSYYLISHKLEAIINSVSILIIFTIVQFILTGYYLRLTVKTAIPLALLIGSCSIPILRLHDSQAVIAVYFIMTSSICAFSPVSIINRIHRLLFSRDIKLFGKVLAIPTLFAVILLVSLASYCLPVIYPILLHLPLGSGIHYTVSHALSLGMPDIKYPAFVRLLITSSGFIFSTSSGLSINIFLRVLVFAIILIPSTLLKPTNCSRRLQVLALTCALSIFAAISLFPGYSNYKYWIPCTPILLAPLSLYPRAQPYYLAGIFTIYLELTIKRLA